MKKYARKRNAENAIRKRLDNLLKLARAAGFVMMMDVGTPAPRRQALTLSHLYLRPLDGSDLFACSCCARPYEPRLRSKLAANYVPLNWCPVCREQLREGKAESSMLAAHAKNRRATGMAIIKTSEARMTAYLESTGSTPGPTHAEATGVEVKQRAE